ncbi:MAG: glycoside hydrolase family 9 protein [Gemmataceae bacterium]|nr:glycoside hydrolase family 9 protein [Gemmataceae bacterium]
MAKSLSARLGLERFEDRLVPASDFTVDFRITSDWGSGFGSSVAVTNLGPDPVSGWTLEFDFNRSIDSIWNARVGSHVGDHYAIRDVGYNKDIPVNGTVSFGFNGSPGNVTVFPANYKLNGVPMGTTPPTLSVNDVRATEGAAATFTVGLSRASTRTVTARYATAAGTATAADFTAASGTLTFAPGETSKTVRVTTTDDTLTEGDETFRLVLSAPTDATLADDTGVGTIADNDPPPGGGGMFNYGEALQKALFFYEAQRSGDLPADYRVNWRGDSAMRDGSDVGVDLTGGYYDAGDHVKFTLPMTSSMTLLAWGLVQYPDAYNRSGQLARIREAVRWGTDWIIKAHPSPNVFYGQVGRGDLDHAVWNAPELMTMPRPAFRLDPSKPGSEVAAEAAAALAAASIAFRTADPTYSATLLRHARELYAFADTYRGKYSDSIPDAAGYYNSYSGYDDELVWGAAWLYKATGEASYLSKAETLYAARFAGQTMTWTHSWDDKRYGSAILLAGLTGKAGYRTDAERYLDYWSVGIDGGATRIAYTPGGLAFLNGWGSLRYASTTAFMALLYGDTVRDPDGRYRDFAARQINYILGNNPRNSSYMVGFGNNPPKNPHHRAASGVWDGNVSNPAPNRHTLYGALVGGPESASDTNYHDDRADYISNEVALDYNAGFTGALARLYDLFGGTPLAEIPREIPTDEFFVEASINQQGPTFTEVRALVNNRSAWPARASTNLSFRYFMDLSEVYAAGFTAADITVRSYYSEGATIGPLTAWDAEKRLYYVEVSFAGRTIVPGAGTYRREAQLRVGLRDGLPAAAWDPGNDWSYQGLPAGRDALTKSAYIPVYEGAAKLYGETPTGLPLPPSPIPPGPGPGVGTVGFRVRDDWGTGFVAEMTITNTGSSPITDWTLEFDFDRDITSIWNAVIVSRVGRHYVIRPASWTATIAPGASITFGFQGRTGNVTQGPTNIVLR